MLDGNVFSAYVYCCCCFVLPFCILYSYLHIFTAAIFLHFLVALISGTRECVKWNHDFTSSRFSPHLIDGGCRWMMVHQPWMSQHSTTYQSIIIAPNVYFHFKGLKWAFEWSACIFCKMSFMPMMNAFGFHDFFYLLAAISHHLYFFRISVFHFAFFSVLIFKTSNHFVCWIQHLIIKKIQSLKPILSIISASGTIIWEINEKEVTRESLCYCR